MKQEDFQAVAELYRFLATFDPPAISAASRLPNISENLRTALIALHQETTNQGLPVSKSSTPSNSSAKKKNGGSLEPYGLLTDKRRFPTKRDLQELAKLLGVEIKVDAKDSHERVARRIATLVTDNPTACKKFYDLVGGAKDTQTAGWIELIRRGV